MTKQEIAEVVLRMVSKGYSDHEDIKDSDDMYNATPEERDIADELIDEILDIGRIAFAEKYSLSSLSS